MSTVRRTVRTTPERVWAVLADGWLYPTWVVGASRMRSVSADWPEPGARLEHSVGVWPALLDDHTEVLESEPTTHLQLRAHGWPMGAAQVDVHLEAQGAATEVSITEDVVEGPGLLVPKLLRDPQIGWRNTETLRRLAMISERRAA